jgi:outer membrane protein TolC
MSKKRIILFLLFLCTGAVHAQKIFPNLDSLLQYATVKNIPLQSGDIRLQQAKKARLAAVLSIPDVTGNISFSYTNNTRLPVNLFPAETFGGQAGTFREVQTGIQYVSNLNENIDIKLLNLRGWENLKLSKLNIETTASDNRLTLKSLQEQIAGIYFNILNLQQQVFNSRQNLLIADTLRSITQNKYEYGLLKQQDVNDATVNYLNAEEAVRQGGFLITQQYLALKILCDIPESDSILITQQLSKETAIADLKVDVNALSFQNSLLKEKTAWSNYKQYKYALYPTLSFFQAYTTQQFNTRGKLFDNRVNWIPSSYVGLRLNIPIPGANSITQASKAKYDYMLAQKASEQAAIKAGLELKQLSADYYKAASQAKANEAIYKLRTDTYEKNLRLYKEGLLSPDLILNSYTAMVNSHYNLVAAQINCLLAKAKIDINNSIK